MLEEFGSHEIALERAHEVYLLTQDTELGLRTLNKVEKEPSLNLATAAELAIQEKMMKIEEFYRLEVNLITPKNLF
jgi:hypothetical protein